MKLNHENRKLENSVCKNDLNGSMSTKVQVCRPDEDDKNTEEEKEIPKKKRNLPDCWSKKIYVREKINRRYII